MQLEEKKNYDDAVETRNHKFVTAKVLNPLLGTCSSMFRSVGINTTQELLASLSLKKKALKKEITNLTSDDETTRLLEMKDKPINYSGFDNMSSSSEQTIYVDEDTDKHNLISNPFRPDFGIESIVLSRKFS